MKAKASLAIIAFLLVLSACNKGNDKERLRILSKSTNMYKDIDNPYWYHRLSEGDTLTLLNKTRKGNNGQAWTLVKNSGQKGWITDTVMLFNAGDYVTGGNFGAVFSNLLTDSYKGRDLNKYLHPDMGIYYAFNQTREHKIRKSATIENNTPYNKAIPDVYDYTIYGFNRCYGADVKPGFYCGYIHIEDFLRYNSRTHPEDDKIIFPDLPIYHFIMRATLIIDNQFESYMYFARIEGNWYLIMVDLCECYSTIDLW